MLSSLIDSYAFNFIFPVLLGLFILFGYYMARKRDKKTGKQVKLIGIESSIISFLALLISFTLASAGSTMKDRLGQIHQESDGLAQLYRSSVFLPDTTKAAVKDFIINHINIQLADGDYADTPDDKMIAQIAVNGERFVNKIRDQKEMAVLLPGYNSLISSTMKLVYSFEERIPKIIMILLIFASLLVGALVGFMSGATEERHYLAPFIYAILVIITIQAIRDLDNPSAGTVKPTYNNLTVIKEMVTGKDK